MNTFSFFINGIFDTEPLKEITLEEFLELIKQENPLIEKIRIEPNKKKRDLLKRGLSYVTFAGTFIRRRKENLIKSSGYACLDFDEIENLQDAKKKLSEDKFSHCVFISPSGNGLKLIVKIPEVKSDNEYKKYWNSISKHFSLLETDEANKDISRACYLSIDKEPYFNKNSEVYFDKIETSPTTQVFIQTEKNNLPKREYSGNKNDFLDTLKSSVSMQEILSNFGVDTSKNPTNCPFHVCSQRCLSFTNETAHCFDSDCSGDNSWNIFSFVKRIKGFNSAEAIEWLSDFAGLREQYEEQKRKYIEEQKPKKEPMGWALSLNIKTIAERRNFLVCPKCKEPFSFNERMGWFKCACSFGGIKKFMEFYLRNKMTLEAKSNE